MASRDPADIKLTTETEKFNLNSFPTRGLRDGMKRWTNGLPGATTRLGAIMALEVLPLVSLDARGYP